MVIFLIKIFESETADSIEVTQKHKIFSIIFLLENLHNSKTRLNFAPQNGKRAA